MADASKLQYYTGYNTYKNLQVRSRSISVTNATVPAGETRDWSTTISVEPDSKFSNALIEINRRQASGAVTALRFAPFPSANQAWQTLATDPVAAVSHDLKLYMRVTGNQVSFVAHTFNPYGGNLAFNPITIDFQYAIHTTAV